MPVPLFPKSCKLDKNFGTIIHICECEKLEIFIDTFMSLYLKAVIQQKNNKMVPCIEKSKSYRGKRKYNSVFHLIFLSDYLFPPHIQFELFFCNHLRGILRTGIDSRFMYRSYYKGVCFNSKITQFILLKHRCVNLYYWTKYKSIINLD